jgi:hypothetical protein
MLLVENLIFVSPFDGFTSAVNWLDSVAGVVKSKEWLRMVNLRQGDRGEK